MKRRVVITGMGLISSIGNSCGEVLNSLLENRSGISFVQEWADAGLKSCVGGTIKNFDFEKARQEIGPKSRYMDQSALFTVLAAKQAIEQSVLTDGDITSERTSCVSGSGVSNSEPLARAGMKISTGSGRTTPFDVTRGMSSSCSANLMYMFGLKGRSYSISSACATALHNIGHGCELIRADLADIVIAGGADEVTAITTAIFDGMRSALATGFNDRPEKASRPYDMKRNGFVISGGSGVVILEEYEHAKKRHAPIIAEVTGYGACSDGHDIIQPHPEGDGAFRCIREALAMASCSPEEIDYINTHGTGTPAGDIAEGLAINKIFADYAVPISSTKGLTGHGLGAAGVQELIYCLLMMQHGFITASVNIDEIDSKCAHLNIITENRQAQLKKVLTNSFGFGGTNACLIVDAVAA